MPEGFRKRLARAIIIDRATPGAKSVVGRVARERTEENYRFAARYVSGKTVLDIGGGTGIGHGVLLEAGARSILSLDRYAGLPAYSTDPRVSFAQGDFLTYPFAEHSFDVVICLGTLFYLNDSRTALNRMRQLLKPRGLLIINCINKELIRRYFKLALEDIDAKFSCAYDEAGFRALLKESFETEPELYVQQPVAARKALPSRLAFWLVPLTWPWRRHPVMKKPQGAEGMYVYAVVTKAG